MCRICGRTIKCIFDSMPSRVAPVRRKRTFSALKSPMSSPECSARAMSTYRGVRVAMKLDAKQEAQLPPPFLLPFRAQLHTSVCRQEMATTAASPSITTDIPVSVHPYKETSPPRSIPPAASAVIKDLPKASIAENAASSSTPLVLSKSVQQLLPILRAQNPHYITAHVHRFPYLLTAGDTLRLPFHMHGVEPGDVIRFNRASLIGSREYTLKAGTTHTETYDGNRTGQPQYLDERLFECRARVLGVDSGPLMTKEKTKRRNRKVKTAKSKHRYTVLKIMEVRIKGMEELNAEQGTLLLGSSD